MQVECTGNSSIEKKQTQKNRRLSSDFHAIPITWESFMEST